MDFSALPPEINSGRMYAGPGSGSLLAAAASWDALAGELYSAAANCGSVVSMLTSGGWRGPSSVSMASAAAPYVTWLSTTAAQAEQTGAQAKAAAAAHAAAYAMTVPPPLIAANRAQLALLVATNFFGQNAPAIAATEAHYGQMWAQDAAAMYSYAAASQAASQIPPFTAPRQTTNPGGLAAQSGAVSQSAGAAAGQVSAAQAMSAAAQVLQTLGSSTGQLSAPPGLETLGMLSDVAAIPVDLTMDTAIIGAIFGGDAVSWGISAAAELPFVAPLGLAAPAVATVAAATGSLASAAPVAAVGQASSVSGLSVPQGWATAAPEMRLAAAEFASTSSTAGTGTGGMFSSMPLLGGAPLMGLAGRGNTGSRNDQSAEEAKRKAAKGRRSTMW